MARLVARRALGALEPGHGVVQRALHDQVHADVVVGVAEVGIDPDGALALGDRAVDVASVRVGPAEEGVCLGGGTGLDGAPVQLDGGAEVSSAVPREAAPPQLECLGSGVLCGHAFILAGFDGPAHGSAETILRYSSSVRTLPREPVTSANFVTTSSFGASEMTIAS